MIKNILKKDKNQEIKSKILLKRHPNLYSFVYNKRSKAPFIKGVLAGLLIIFILFYNSNYNKFSSNSSVLEIYLRKNSKFMVSYSEKGLKHKIRFNSNEIDSVIIDKCKDLTYISIDKSSYMLIFANSFKIMFVNDLINNKNIIKSDFIFLNSVSDTTFLMNIDKISNPYMIFLDKKFYNSKKRNYILNNKSLKRDQLIFSENRLVVVVKQKPFGLKMIKYNKKR